jgi:hypothetical protein
MTAGEREDVSYKEKSEIQNLALQARLYANRHAEIIEDALKHSPKTVLEILRMMPHRKREPGESPWRQYKRILARKANIDSAEEKSDSLHKEHVASREASGRAKKAGLGASNKELAAMLELRYRGDTADVSDVLAESVIESVRKLPMIGKEDYERSLRLLHNLGE